MRFIHLILSLLILNLSFQATKKKVDNLFGDLYSGDVYSGYLKTKSEGKELFYIYFPSQNNPDTAPLLLWLNGGPGCSSLFGMLAEIGPVTSENFSGEWKTNPFSWNTNSNLLFIEQPAGVGFTKTDDPNYTWNDDDTAEHLMSAIKDFLASFEELKQRPFYVSGESYAGVYIPFLTTHILKDTSEDKINIKGVLIGNGLTDFDTDVERSMVEFGFNHGLLSYKVYKSFQKFCLHLPDELNPEANNEQSNDGFFPRNVTHHCNEIRDVIRNNLGGNDMYGIYRICPPKSRMTPNDPLYFNSEMTMRNTIYHRLKQLKRMNTGTSNSDIEEENDVWPSGCGDDLTIDKFLNDNSTKEKLEVDKSIIWTQCSTINYDMSDSIKFYSETIQQYPDLRIWFFSGTEDGVLPTLGTMRWINKLNFKIKTEWRQWLIDDNQVAGYAQEYEERLVLVTVKGAGHMVPQDQKASAFKMVSAFLNGTLPE